MQPHSSHVDIIDHNAAIGGFDDTEQRQRQRALARTRSSHNAYLLPLSMCADKPFNTSSKPGR